jgi:alpha-galactosidase
MQVKECLATLSGVLLATQFVMAQQVTIPVQTAHHAQVFQVTKNKDLNTIWFGEKLADAAEYGLAPGAYRQSEDYTDQLNSAYTPAGSRNLAEPAIAVTHADGNNSLDLKYVSHQLTRTDDNVSLLTIRLKDPVYDFEVTLFYKTWFKEDVVEQWSEIRHHEKGNVVLHKFASANLHLQAPEFWLKQYHGDWAKEMQPEESKLTHGIRTLDTKLGTRANLFQPSAFMVSLGKPATEDEGTVLYGGLEYSGNFRVDLELDPRDNLRIIARYQ